MRQMLILLVIMVALVACEDTTAPERYTNDWYYILIGRLEEGRPITLERPVFVGKTVPADGGYLQNMNLTEDAQIVITDVETGTVYPLLRVAFNPNPSQNDSLVLFIEPTATLIPAGGKTYRIEATIGEALLSAETTVPHHVSVLPDSGFTSEWPPSPDAYPTMVYDTLDRHHPIRISAQGDSTLRLFHRFYCLEEWEDARYTMEGLGLPENPESSDDYEDPGTGEPRKIEWVNLYVPALTQDNQYIITNASYQMTVWFYGRYEMTFWSVDENYYRYLYKPEGYNYGGIRNGLGYFGSVSGSRIYTKIVE